MDMNLIVSNNFDGFAMSLALTVCFDFAVGILIVATILKQSLNSRVLARRILAVLSITLLVTALILFFLNGFQTYFNQYTLLPPFVFFALWVPMYLVAPKNKLPSWTFAGKSKSFKKKVYMYCVSAILLMVLPNYLGNMVFKIYLPLEVMDDLIKNDTFLEIFSIARAWDVLTRITTSCFIITVLFFVYISILKYLKTYKVLD